MSFADQQLSAPLTGQPRLQQQDLPKPCFNKLASLSPKATTNFGTIDHVAHGKSSVSALQKALQRQAKRSNPKRKKQASIEDFKNMSRPALRDRKAILGQAGNCNGCCNSNEGFNTSPRDPLSKGKENFSQVACKRMCKEKVRYCSLLNDCMSNEVEHDSVQSKINDIQNTIRTSDRYQEALTLHNDGLKPASEIIAEYEQYDFDILRSNLLEMAKLRKDFWSDSPMWNQIEQAMCQELSFSKRKSQLAQLQAFETMIKSHEPTMRVVVANDIDLDPPPNNFTYVPTSIIAKGIIVSNDPLHGCKCEPCHARSKCCGRLRSDNFAYTPDGRLRFERGTPIYECNEQCICSASGRCFNRVVQNGSRCNLTLFKTSNGRGWGLKTNDIIKKGQYISEYCGKVISTEDAEKYGNMHNASYLFDLDFVDPNSKYTIDATEDGNISRFYNHSCEPNCAIWPVWINSSDPHMPRLALFALQSIKAGKELTLDYVPNNGQAVDDASTVPENIASSFECLCGTLNCRKRLWT